MCVHACVCIKSGATVKVDHKPPPVLIYTCIVVCSQCFIHAVSLPGLEVASEGSPCKIAQWSNTH